MNLRALAGLLAGTAVIVLAGSAGAAPSREPDPVTCDNRAGRHALAIRMRDEFERFRVPPRFADRLPPGQPTVFEERFPAEATIERRIDEVTVLDESSDGNDPFFEPSEGVLRSCGPTPTVTNVDSIRVGLGKRSETGELTLNMQYGTLAPGFTDEGDGSSEIELDARLGDGFVAATMTRGPDSIAVRRPSGETGPSRINLNASEPSPDYDVTIGGNSLVGLLAGGGDDSLKSSGFGDAFDPREPFGLVLVGGQGADTLDGGDGFETIFAGPGADQVEAGGGSDLVVAVGRGVDRIDCGPGQDYVIVTRRGNRLRRCEVVDDEELFSRPTPRKILQGKRFRALLQRR